MFSSIHIHIIRIIILFRERERERENAPLLSSLSLFSLSLSLFKATFIIKGEERKREFDRIGETLNNVLISAKSFEGREDVKDERFEKEREL